MGVKVFNVSEQGKLLIQFPSVHQRAVVSHEGGRLVVLNDKCRHRGGPLHLCFEDKEGTRRCPWHGYAQGKQSSSDAASAIYIATAGVLTVIADVADNREWPVKVLEF